MRSGVCTILLLALALAGCGEDPEHLLTKARIAMENGRPDLALADVDKILAEQPQHLDALLIKAEARMRQANLPQARKLIDQALAANANHAPTYVKLADWSMLSITETIHESEGLFTRKRQDEYDQAVALAGEQAAWLESHGDNKLKVRLIRAKLARLEAARLEAILHRLKTQLELGTVPTPQEQPDTPDGKTDAPSPAAAPADTQPQADDKTDADEAPAEELTIEQLETRINQQLDIATSELRQILDTDAKQYDAAVIYLRLLLKRQQWEEIWKYANTLEAHENLPPDLPFELTGALLAMPDDVHPLDRRIALGKAVRNQTINTARQGLPWRMGGARLFMAEKNWEKADSYLQLVRQSSPRHTEATYLQAARYFNLKRFEEAEDLLYTLKSVLPDSFEVQALYGRTLLQTRNFPAAKAALDASRRLRPNDQGIHLEWMRVAAHLGHLYEAEPHIDAHYEANPDDRLAIMLMLRLDRSRNRRENVRVLLTKLEGMEDLTEAQTLALMDGYRYLEDFKRVEAYAKQMRATQPNSVRGQLILAESLLAQKRDEDAEQLLVELRAQKPDDAAVGFLLARFYLQRQQYESAMPILEQLVEKDPRNEVLRVALAQGLAGISENARALSILESVLEQSPANVNARALVINIYQLTRRHDKVAEHLHQLDIKRLDEEQWPALLAQVRLSRGELDEAVQIANRALERGEIDPTLRLLLATIERGRNNVKGADEHYVALIKSQPDNQQIYQLYARFCVATGRFEPGLKQLNEFEALNPTLTALARSLLLSGSDRDAEIPALLEPVLASEVTGKGRFALITANTLANAYGRLGKGDQAVSTFDKLITAGVRPGPARLAQAAMLRRLGRTDEALTKLDEAAQATDVARVGESIQIIEQYVYLDELEKALAITEKLIAARPGQGVFIRFQGDLLLQLGRSDRALSSFERALSIDAADLEAREGLAKVHVATGDFAAAESVYLQMAGLGRDGRVMSSSGLGRMFLALGLNGKAASTYDQLERFSPPRNPAVLLGIAQAYVRLGDDDRAFARLGQIQQFAPQYGQAQVQMVLVELRRNKPDDARQRVEQLMRFPNGTRVVIPMMAGLLINEPANRRLLRWFDEVVDLQTLMPQHRVLWLGKRFQILANQGDWAGAADTIDELAKAQVTMGELEETARRRRAAMRFAVVAHLGRMDQATKIYETEPVLVASSLGPLMATITGKPAPAGAKAAPIARFINAMAKGDKPAAGQAIDQLSTHPTIFREDLRDSLNAPAVGSTGVRNAHRRMALAAYASAVGLNRMATEICSQVITEQPQAAVAWGLLLALDEKAGPTAGGPKSLAMYRSAVDRGDSADDLSAAINALEKLMRREPVNDHLRYRFARTCEQAGRIDRAIAMHLELWEKDGPFKYQSGNDAAYLIAENQPDNLAKAATIVNQVIEAGTRGTGEAALLDTAGWIDHKRGQNDQALLKINEALLDLNSTPDVHRHVAAVYAALGNSSWRNYHLDQARALEK